MDNQGTINGLKPCGHCGSTDLYEIEEKDDLQIPQPAIFCNTCKTTFTVEDDSQTLDDAERMKYLKQKVRDAWNRRAEPKNNPLTNFDRITESPEMLAEFIQDIEIDAMSKAANFDTSETNWLAWLKAEVNE